ncbi:hypothetical protein FOZ63_019696, partial [Perkinsus olseni]
MPTENSVTTRLLLEGVRVKWMYCGVVGELMMAIGEEEEEKEDNKGGKGTRDSVGMFILWWLEVNDDNEFNVKSERRIAVKLDIVQTNCNDFVDFALVMVTYS